MTHETTRVIFEVDGIQYIDPAYSDSVYVRPMIQIFDDGQRLCSMRVSKNTSKKGIMDSEVDEKFLKEYWG